MKRDSSRGATFVERLRGMSSVSGPNVSASPTAEIEMYKSLDEKGGNLERWLELCSYAKRD